MFISPEINIIQEKHLAQISHIFLQVCGNTESVKLMNEWLCLWHERGFQPSKDFLSSDEEKSQDADYNCSESDSDSENIGAEDCLKNVLLIVGPVGVCDKIFCHELSVFMSTLLYEFHVWDSYDCVCVAEREVCSCSCMR